MKFTLVALLGFAAASQSTKHNQAMLYNLMQIEADPACPPPLAITEDELHFQLGEFSRNFDIKNWDNAMTIRSGLAGSG